MTNPIYYVQFLRISKFSVVVCQLSSKFCPNDVLNNWKMLDKFPNMKTKWEKNKEFFCETATAENYGKLQIIIIVHATFSFHWLTLRGKKRVMRRWNVKQENPVTLQCSIPTRNFIKVAIACGLYWENKVYKQKNGGYRSVNCIWMRLSPFASVIPRKLFSDSRPLKMISNQH